VTIYNFLMTEHETLHSTKTDYTCPIPWLFEILSKPKYFTSFSSFFLPQRPDWIY
jgi:hypothetical protein